MTTKTSQGNPYIAGRALGQQRGFFGREDILRLVESSLRSPDQNALVLFGQRRIGKTSILLQLQRRLPSPPFLPVYFDLMERARRPLGQVLFEIAATIAAEAGMAPVEPEQFDDQGVYFRRTFLPGLYLALGEGQDPMLLLDEFDVLDVAEEQLSPTAAAQAFFPYLRELLEGEPRLKFVFVVGRRAEDLSINVKETFKTTLYQRISVLDERSARELITTAEHQGTLTFEPTATDRILALTAGHPYFIQLLCQILWDSAHTYNSSVIPSIDVAAVEDASAKALEAGQNIFEWIWDGLPPVERVIFAAIAEATNEQSLVTEEQLTQMLQSRGIRILTRQLELAPRTLVEWEMLRQMDGSYRFFIELMRRWIATRKPLPKVKEELDRIVPLADALYRSGDGYYRQCDLESALSQLRRALQVSPNHVKARLLLGEILLEQDNMDEAIRELEEAYSYDDAAGRYPLIQALMIRGEEFKRSAKYKDALTIYERILKLSPTDGVAQVQHAEILVKIGDQALREHDIEAALRAYQKADSEDSIARRVAIILLKALSEKEELERKRNELETSLRGLQSDRLTLQELVYQRDSQIVELEQANNTLSTEVQRQRSDLIYEIAEKNRLEGRVNYFERRREKTKPFILVSSLILFLLFILHLFSIFIPYVFSDSTTLFKSILFAIFSLWVLYCIFIINWINSMSFEDYKDRIFPRIEKIIKFIAIMLSKGT